MHFNTFSYFLFLPLVFLIHYFTPDRFRWILLLGASFYFYATLKAPHLIAVLLLITTITYFTGILINRQENQRTKQYLLWGGISANVLTLIILKYLPFITQNLNLLLKQLAPGTTVPVSKTIIAIGVSYFIFQAISYLIDIYLEIEKPERHYGHFALYMSFFPKLLQGPIERSGDLLPQFKIPYVFNYDNVRGGMLLFVLGLFKKIVIADRLALLINPVFDNVYAYKGLLLLLTTYSYSLQIYFDFSGYTDMAVGTAKMFNISLTQNFNRPYLATSIADFWRRWHISFSRWLLDYIFKPLQMSWRNWGNWGTATALMITFTISGLWHGASWGFIIWGTLHGLYLASSIVLKSKIMALHKKYNINSKSQLYKLCQTIYVFNLVSLTWIFFRCDELNKSFYVIKNIMASIASLVFDYKLIEVQLYDINNRYNANMFELLIIIICITPLFYNSDTLIEYINRTRVITRWAVYISLLTFMAQFMITGASNFIYFGF